MSVVTVVTCRWVTSACSSIVATFSHSYGNSDLVGDRATKGRGGSGVHRLFFPYRGLLERVEVVFFMLHTTIKPTCPVSTAFTLKDDTTPQVAVATKLERMKGKKEGKIERDEHDRLGVEAGDNSETAQGRECCVGHSIKKGTVAIKDSTPERVGEGSSEERVSRACHGGGARGPEGKKKTDLTGKTPQLLAAFGVRGFAACCVFDTCGAHVDPGFQHVYAAPAGEIMRPRRRRRRRTGSGRLAHVRAPLPTANRGCSPPPSSPFVLPSPYISALPCHTSPATTTALSIAQSL
ncbi:hypothetical protein B296_00037749 [Ensete ventricosum]|uniref:Uncharacterized protein n=1 Tax=Ensete ventricosum TaxID=4639 RepID=A0A426ZYN1_ENSVE|nr:hypothetical protein B296_00037749 [Ensete ventricosum]